MRKLFLFLLGLAVAAFVLWSAGMTWYKRCGESWCLSTEDSSSSSSVFDPLSEGPATVSSSSALEANIIVDAPLSGAEVSPNAIIIRGTARVFENQFRYRVLDADRTVLGEGSGTAVGDAGQFNPFEITVQLFKQPSGAEGTIEVFDESAKDGSVIDLVTVSVVFVTSESRATE